MIVLKDFLPPGFAENLEYQLSQPSISWSYNYESTLTDKTDPRLFVVDENTIKPHQFIHSVYNLGEVHDSNLYLMCNILLQLACNELKISIKELHRIKCNILTKDVRFTLNNYGITHVDVGDINTDDSYKTLLYYVNTSDGDTFLFNEHATENTNTKLSIKERSSPEIGKAIYFNSNQFHASSNPVINNSRFVINYTFKI